MEKKTSQKSKRKLWSEWNRNVDKHFSKPISRRDIPNHPQFAVPTRENDYDVVGYGLRIKKLRERLGITMSELGDEVGCSYQTIQQIEGGARKSVNLELTPYIAAYLNCTSCYLLGISESTTGVMDPDGNLRILPIMVSLEDEYVFISSLQSAYRYDSELCQLCIELLKGSHEQRKHYKKVLRKMLQRDIDN